jgi:dolichol kinase
VSDKNLSLRDKSYPMDLFNFAYLVIFIVAIIYILIKNRESFLIKILVSIPIMAGLVYFSGSFFVLPVYLFSLVVSTYLYTVFFYFPFAVDIVLIILSIFGKFVPVRFIFAAISISILLSMFLDKNMRKYDITNNEKKGKDIKRETYRDYFQISTGVITIAIFAFEGIKGRILILLAVLIIYLAGNILYLNNKNRIADIVYMMEREDTKLGLGSMYLAAGFLLVLSFTRSLPVIYISAFMIMIGDSLATIIGMKIRSRKLIYNKRKSIAGFMAMLLPSFLFGLFFFVYFYSAIYALGGTFAESISNKIADDNITIPISIVVLHLIIAMA